MRKERRIFKPVKALRAAMCMAEILIVLGVAASCASSDDKEAAQITLKEAEEIALLDAGVKASDVSYTKEKLDYEDGIAVYEIEFFTDTHEYEYEINAITGKVYSRESENRSHENMGQSSNSEKLGDYIGEEEAKAIAIDHAGFSDADVRFSKVELDYDDGQKVYEIEFYREGNEYEYEINALSGKIVKYKMD